MSTLHLNEKKSALHLNEISFLWSRIFQSISPTLANKLQDRHILELNATPDLSYSKHIVRPSRAKLVCVRTAIITSI